MIMYINLVSLVSFAMLPSQWVRFVCGIGGLRATSWAMCGNVIWHAHDPCQMRDLVDVLMAPESEISAQ